MASKLTELNLTPRDGTSQAARRLGALDPDYASVDERTIEDLLAFARAYGRELAYFDFSNQQQGDWSAFLGPDLKLGEVAAFLREPERFTPQNSPELFRPHLVLFLTFLALLRRSQDELNGLTRRHLDYYYRQVLQMRTRPAVPDRVNLLVDLAGGVRQALLSAGSLVGAGEDSMGRERFYRTDHDLVVNTAQVARLSSVHIDRQVTGLAEIRESRRNDKKGASLGMFEIALGDPLPGDPLPPYPGSRRAPDMDFITGLYNQLQFAGTQLHLKFFELRALVNLKRRRDQADEEWRQINALLEGAGRRRDPAFRLDLTEPRNFDRNLTAAMGGVLDFAGLPEVKSIYDLYEQRIRQDVRQFISQRLFLDFNDFVRLMQIKVRIDSEWREINRILEEAGGRKAAGFRFPPEGSPGFDPTDFAANFRSALGVVDFSVAPGANSIETYYAAVMRVEKYFFLTAEEFSHVMWTMERTEPGAPAADWAKVDELLGKAHREKVYGDRRAILNRAHRTRGFSAMIREALGEDPIETEDPSALERLTRFVGRRADVELLTRAATAPPTGFPWERVYSIVEIAQRVAQRLPEPVPRRVEWLNLYPAEDATTAGVREAGIGQQGPPRWRTFGVTPAEAASGTAPPPVLGWAVCSPTLEMSEGRRDIAVTLGFRSGEFDTSKLRELVERQSPLTFEISTNKGWAPASSLAAQVGTYNAFTKATGTDGPAIRFALTFTEDVDPFEPPTVGSPTSGPWPVLRAMLRPSLSAKEKRLRCEYDGFRRLLITAVHLAVSVTGLKPLRLSNDETTLDPKKPFEPFGGAPVVGSCLLLGHPEVSSKRLDSLRFRIEWMGVPKNLADHYKNYGLGDNPEFSAQVSLIDQRVVLPLVTKAVLFSATGSRQSIDVASVSAALPAGYRYEPMPEAVYGDDLSGWPRYLQWELNAPDFQHLAYPAVAASKSVAMAADIANKTAVKAADYQVNPPYTPKIKSLSLDYTASAELRFDGAPSSATPVRLLHLHPFGYCDVTSEAAPGGPPLLAPYDNEGELYIGLADVRAPQSVSLLFQMAEGTADPDVVPSRVLWSRLSGDRWIPLDDALLLDTTRGLINSGIIELALKPAEPSTRLPGNYYWIRAAAAGNSTGVCDTSAVHTQAVSATLVEQGVAPDHFSRPLPAGTITGLRDPRPEIGGLRQPYTSYGGRPAEEDNAFATRVSERLRHKRRAVTVWDYERLVLDRFPGIYKVKCIPASALRSPDDPGLVEVIVIPDIRGKLPFDPYEPKAPANLLADIEEYLKPTMPASARLRVRNAFYVTVKVRFAVRFKAGGNESYYRRLLNEELNRFLSPWAYEEGADIVIGGRIYASSIINFLDCRPYVDYVADIRLFTSDDGRNFQPVERVEAGGYWVSAGRPDGVLVAAREHQIDFIPETGYEEELFTGINYMKLELDFVVA